MPSSTKSSIVPLVAILSLASAPFPVFASDPPDCDITETCAAPKYEVAFPKYDCPSHGYLAKACREPWEPPYPASFNCEYTYGGYLCEAWPQGSTLRYAYSASGPISIPYPVSADSPIVSVACWTSGSGSLTVTITSTSAPGQSSVITQSLYCP